MSEELLLALAGLIVPFLIQLVKAVHKWLADEQMTSGTALSWTFALCLVVAAVAKVLGGELFIPPGGLAVALPELLAQFGVVIGLATTIYKLLLTKETGLRSLKR